MLKVSQKFSQIAIFISLVQVAPNSKLNSSDNCVLPFKNPRLQANVNRNVKLLPCIEDLLLC